MNFTVLETPKCVPIHPGSALLFAGCAREAVPFLEEWLAKEPDSAQCLNELGSCHKYLGNFELAESLIRKSIDLEAAQPSSMANLALVLEDLGRFQEAQQWLEKSWAILTSLNPVVIAKARIFPKDIAYPLALSYLRFGQYDKAWPLWMGRHGRSDLPDIPIWFGQPLKGKRILIFPNECGHGDVVWLMRYLQNLKELGAHVTFYTWKSMRKLLESCPWIDRCIDDRDNTETGDYDFQAKIWSLMAVLDLCPLGMTEPYIKAEPYKPRGDRPRIGICWQASDSMNPGYKTREMTPSMLQKFRDLPFDFVSLQFGVPCPDWMENVDEIMRVGWHETARVFAGCDLVISVDTAAAHLAGAMGIETLVLVPLASDWKMGLGTDQSPWYPTWRLFRSTDPHGAGPAVEQIVLELMRRFEVEEFRIPMTRIAFGFEGAEA